MSGHCCNGVKRLSISLLRRLVSIPLCRVIVVTFKRFRRNWRQNYCLNPLMSGHCCNTLALNTINAPRVSIPLCRVIVVTSGNTKKIQKNTSYVSIPLCRVIVVTYVELWWVYGYYESLNPLMSGHCCNKNFIIIEICQKSVSIPLCRVIVVTLEIYNVK